MIRRGDPVPDGPLMRLINGQPVTQDPRICFATGRHVIVGVAGAFTPISEVRHLPEYVRLHDTLMSSGMLSSIACVCVTDPFVIEAWGSSKGCDGKIVMYADPTGAFTRQCGLDADFGYLGLGVRSSRYVLILADGRVERLSIEADAHEVDTTSARSVITQSHEDRAMIPSHRRSA